MQPASCAASAPLYLARWAMDAAPQFSAFAPSSRLRRAILSWLPARHLLIFFRPLLSIFRRLLLPAVSAQEITDGNVNFSHVVTAGPSDKLFVKQAQGFLKWQPQLALERERMEREVKYLRDVACHLGADAARRFLPTIHTFDAHSSVLVMEYLEGYRVLFEALFESATLSVAVASGLGEYLGRVIAATLESPTEPALAARLAAEYWNPTLRAIQVEHVSRFMEDRKPPPPP